MQQTNESLLLLRHDYETILFGLKHSSNKATFNKQDAEELVSELKKAKLVKEAEMPADVVRLNSTVLIRDVKENKSIELTVVMPEKADIKQRRISIFSPIGTALIGYKKGEKVSWKVPAGTKTFIILDVKTPYP